MTINATDLDYRELNETLRNSRGKCNITNCLGQRFLAAGISDKNITVSGIPGNALGAYLNGARIEVMGNAQDAVGDTMNDGSIVIHGSVGDAVGYAMRGGRIYVQGSAGYRAGIHMKAYKEKQPTLIIGGKAGSFLGEYQAGGMIIVLGLEDSDRPIVGNFPSTGMHGGKMLLRSDCKGIHFPHQVHVRPADKEDMKEASHYLRHYCTYFNFDLQELLDHPFTVVTPDSSNPYRQMYVAN
ncbi:glutamate synthase [Ruminococcus sp.]|uniref:GltB/FmdC/FwdC-like GXGXG domain-containing protein n=1 Tax=Ruminococcus sp. TaxID=41978 RepID=UPI003449C2A1